MLTIPLAYLLLIPAAYLIGSVPTGIIMSRFLGGADPRTAGSKNIGATNVGRTSGKAAGILTLAGDIAKGALPVFAATRLHPDAAFISSVGVAAFIGHLYPVYLGFKGGKGVATAFGIITVICPLAAVLSAAVFFAAVFVKRYVSLASMASSAMLPVFLSFIPEGRDYVVMGAIVGVLIILKHRDNIKRLAAGTENRIGGKKG